MSRPDTVLRIFHVVESLDRGAVENWLVDVFIESRKTNPDWQWTFYCMIGSPGRLDEKVISNGGTILRSPVSISNKAAFLWYLRKALTRQRYDILHVHHDFLSGFYLLAALGIPFRKRILHIHNNDRHLPVGNDGLRRILLPIFRWLSLRMVDNVVAISEYTRDDYKGSFSGRSPVFEVLYYGIDMSRFAGPSDASRVRMRLRIPEEARLLLYAGRMNVEKNPIFTLDILKAMLMNGVDAYLVLVGKGEKEHDILERTRELGLVDRVRILGWSDGISDLMKSADAFVFPRMEHPREGLGLVVVEAQCAGIPIFITPGIVRDAVELPEIAHWNPPIDAGRWARNIEEILAAPPRISREAALERMKGSKFALSIATKNLLAHYILNH
jgi:glycosyltransferase involved in cell wall biosynthesis